LLYGIAAVVVVVVVAAPFAIAVAVI